MAELTVVVHGALGKMGQEVLNAVNGSDGLVAVGGADFAASESTVTIPNSNFNVPLTNDLSQIISSADVVVDFTNAEGARSVMATSAPAGVHCVIGSTGMSESDLSLARTLADDNDTCIIIAPNFAMGAVLMTHLVGLASKFFDYADLTEVHHEAKIDAPSGTAISIAQAAAQGKQSPFEAPTAEKELINNTRGGDHSGVVIHSGRMPGRVAHHEMVFGALGQTLTIRHDSINRESFMPGVIMAIKETTSRRGLTIGLDKIMGL